MTLMKTIILLLTTLLISVGCESYADRFSAKDSNEDQKGVIEYSDIKYYKINGVKKKAKKLDYDKNDILRREVLYNNNQISRIRSYDDRGRISVEENFNDGGESGEKIIFYTNGNIKEEYDFSNNLKNGNYNSYYINGSLESNLEFDRGRIKGSCSWYYPTGQLMRIKEFLKKEYYQIEFYKNGNKKSEGSMRYNNVGNQSIVSNSFSGDVFVGRWIYYSENGSIIKEEDH